MSNAIDPRRSVLVLVDYQERLLPAIHDGAAVVSRAVRLADVARELGIRVVGTEQNPRGLGHNAPAVRSRCESTLSKMHFDGCANGLADHLASTGNAPPSDVVIAGCEAHVCLMQTTLGLLRAGFRLWVVADACGSRFPRDHAIAMDRLRQADAVVVSAEMVMFEWLQSCEHERFKRVLQVAKDAEAAK